MWRGSTDVTDEERIVYYDRSRYITGAGIAVLLAIIAAKVFGWPPTSTTYVQKEEADIIVIDPTSDGAAWRDARGNVVNRIAHAFGQTTVSGTLVGDGATGNISIIPVGRDTNNTNVISVLSYQELANLRDSLYGSSVAPRAIDTYEQLLSGDAPSLWKFLVQSQLGSPDSLASASSATCESVAMGEISNRKRNSPKFATVMEDVTSNGIDSQKLSASLCTQIVKVAQGVHSADRIMAGKLRACKESEAGAKVPCSDILGATRVIDTLMSDFARIDGSESEGVKIQMNVCTLFASDMMHYNNEGPLLPRVWDKDSDNGEEASAEGQKSAYRYAGSDGFHRPSGGSEIYMPYLGNLTYNKQRTVHEINELKFYWESFFSNAGMQPMQGSTSYACSGNEPHVTR